jgi:hypothetical protein
MSTSFQYDFLETEVFLAAIRREGRIRVPVVSTTSGPLRPPLAPLGSFGTLVPLTAPVAVFLTNTMSLSWYHAGRRREVPTTARPASMRVAGLVGWSEPRRFPVGLGGPSSRLTSGGITISRWGKGAPRTEWGAARP